MIKNFVKSYNVTAYKTYLALNIKMFKYFVEMHSRIVPNQVSNIILEDEFVSQSFLRVKKKIQYLANLTVKFSDLINIFNSGTTRHKKTYGMIIIEGLIIR